MSGMEKNEPNKYYDRMIHYFSLNDLGKAWFLVAVVFSEIIGAKTFFKRQKLLWKCNNKAKIKGKFH